MYDGTHGREIITVMTARSIWHFSCDRVQWSFPEESSRKVVLGGRERILKIENEPIE